MLQSRPVTNLDNSYTDYEIMHELDSSHPTEFEIYSRAHWGENFPGATSWTALQIHWGNKSSFVRRSLAMRLSTVEDYNPFVENMGCEYNQVMFNISNGAMTGFFEGYPKSKPAVSMVLACAEVPNNLREIAKSIKNKESFRQLSDEEALQVLIKGTDESSAKFKQFLERNCLMRRRFKGYREADAMYKPWKGNPMPCIKTIKTMLSGSGEQLEPKVEKSVDQVLDELKTPLTPIRKFLIKNIFLPYTRRGVGYRELSKYFMIWMNNHLKDGFWYLAQQMANEGLIPSVDSFFYLTADEVEAL
ncbi:unnamed protein product [Oppiella nova]|uniref:Uncharacterized protein n=1 Tax=Oppiella nova TaxID=334625 RepID=A0A7R9QH12_9ACAR|nr:unnamed protein product [Oppiella nova]CAG2165609.1 unnamed protein product [Oppiella nova]